MFTYILFISLLQLLFSYISPLKFQLFLLLFYLLFFHFFFHIFFKRSFLMIVIFLFFQFFFLKLFIFFFFMFKFVFKFYEFIFYFVFTEFANLLNNSKSVFCFSQSGSSVVFVKVLWWINTLANRPRPLREIDWLVLASGIALAYFWHIID
jgi:hypothetical protein